MQIYLVGGAVRDELLGLPVTDRDWVVVGATPEAMLAAGFRPVGRDFPVFLHPQTQEEYALARTERKQGRGYTGFVVHASPEVTLEQDLLRRDLSINAMAKDAQGRLIDPYGGQQAIRDRRLSAVSPAFAEDPLRILRTARFAARFHGLDFQVDADTLDLMRQMVKAGELQDLARERVLQELCRALQSDHPQVFIDCLDQVQATGELWPAWSDWLATHPLQAFDGTDWGERLALNLVHCPQAELTAICQAFGLPNAAARLIHSVVELADHPGLQAQDAEAVMALLQALDAWRQPEPALRALACLARVSTIPSVQWWSELIAALKQQRLPDSVMRSLEGPAIGAALQQQRTRWLEDYLGAPGSQSSSTACIR